MMGGIVGPAMNQLYVLALNAWSETSAEGLLVLDADGHIQLLNARLRELLKLDSVPATLDRLLLLTQHVMPELCALSAPFSQPPYVQWGNLRIDQYSPQRLIWQQVPLLDADNVVGSVIVFHDATSEGQLDLAKQSFLSMISHDLRTPLSTILGFAELLYNNRSGFSDEEQREFLEHIIRNANQLSRYSQIALDIMYLEANLQNFDTEAVNLGRFVDHWLSDAQHRFSTDHIVFVNKAFEGLQALVAPPALHRILYILLEFALAESPAEGMVEIQLDSNSDHAYLYFRHFAPSLKTEEALTLFRLMYPRDLSEAGRPQLHRMQLYVAHLLAEQQQGFLTLRGQSNRRYEFSLAMPLVSHAILDSSVSHS